jgi:hypothetical protein
VAAAPFSLSGHQQALPRPQRTIRMNDVNQLIALDKQKNNRGMATRPLQWTQEVKTYVSNFIIENLCMNALQSLVLKQQ